MCKNEVRDAFRVHYIWTVLGYAQACRTVARLVVNLEFRRPDSNCKQDTLPEISGPLLPFG